MLPPTPPPEGLHPLVIHFPIALLLVSALFVFFGALFPVRGWWFRCAALILLGLGTLGAFVSVRSGEKARDVVEEGSDAMFQTLEKHEELTKKAMYAFTALSVVYAILLGLPLLSNAFFQPSVHVPLHLVFLAVLMAGNLLLANAAHLGGLLVHEFGVRAPVSGGSSQPGTTEATEPPAEAETAPAQPAEAKPDESKPDAESPKEPSSGAAGQ